MTKTKSPMGRCGVPYMRMNDWNMSQREDFGGVVGQDFIYRDDLPVVTEWDAATIVAPGMQVRVIYTFRNWNFVDGLTLHYVYVPATGMYTHVSESALSVFEVDDDSCAERDEFGSCIHSAHMALR